MKDQASYSEQILSIANAVVERNSYAGHSDEDIITAYKESDRRNHPRMSLKKEIAARELQEECGIPKEIAEFVDADLATLKDLWRNIKLAETEAGLPKMGADLDPHRKELRSAVKDFFSKTGVVEIVQKEEKAKRTMLGR